MALFPSASVAHFSLKQGWQLNADPSEIAVGFLHEPIDQLWAALNNLGVTTDVEDISFLSSLMMYALIQHQLRKKKPLPEALALSSLRWVVIDDGADIDCDPETIEDRWYVIQTQFDSYLDCKSWTTTWSALIQWALKKSGKKEAKTQKAIHTIAALRAQIADTLPVFPSNVFKSQPFRPMFADEAMMDGAIMTSEPEEEEQAEMELDDLALEDSDLEEPEKEAVMDDQPKDTDAKTGPHHLVIKPEDLNLNYLDDQEASQTQRLAERLSKVPLRCWTEHTEALATLRMEFPWAQNALSHVELLLTFWRKMGSSAIRFPPMLLVGAAGCGKTRLARRLAETLSLPLMTVSGVAGGAHQIKGTERAWSNGTPSPLLRFMADTQCANPLVLVDEIDKQEENQWTGTLQQALLGLTEPENARQFRDPFMEVPCDLSPINWVLTANDVHAIGGPLLTRLEVITVGHPRPEHLPGIIHGVRMDLARAVGSTLEQLPWTDQDERWVRQQMGAMFSAREARKLIEKRLMVTVTQTRPDLQAVSSTAPMGGDVFTGVPETATPQRRPTVVALHRSPQREPQT